MVYSNLWLYWHDPPPVQPDQLTPLALMKQSCRSLYRSILFATNPFSLHLSFQNLRANPYRPITGYTYHFQAFLISYGRYRAESRRLLDCQKTCASAAGCEALPLHHGGKAAERLLTQQAHQPVTHLLELQGLRLPSQVCTRMFPSNWVGPVVLA